LKFDVDVGKETRFLASLTSLLQIGLITLQKTCKLKIVYIGD